MLSGARQLFAAGDIAAVIWERSAFRSRATQGQVDDEIVGFLSANGFAHFRMEDENRGGRLIRLQRTDEPCNVYSLASRTVPKERYQ